MSNEQIIEALKKKGMRITKQRKLVAGIIADNDETRRNFDALFLP